MPRLALKCELKEEVDSSCLVEEHKHYSINYEDFYASCTPEHIWICFVTDPLLVVKIERKNFEDLILETAKAYDEQENHTSRISFLPRTVKSEVFSASGDIKENYSFVEAAVFSKTVLFSLYKTETTEDFSIKYKKSSVGFFISLEKLVEKLEKNLIE